MEHFVLKYDIIIKKIRIRGVFVSRNVLFFLLLQLNTLYIFPRKKISHKINKRKKIKNKEIEHIKISCREISLKKPYAEFSQSFGSEYVY